MTPSHFSGIEAARRVMLAHEMDEPCDPDDAITMHVYQISVELRRLPEAVRMRVAREMVGHILDNTQESLVPDDDE